MTMSPSILQGKLRLLQPRHVARGVEAIGIPRKYLSRLVERGQAERIGRGLYMAADAKWEPHHSLAAVAARVPHGVVCLLSALLFHELTSELPRET